MLRLVIAQGQAIQPRGWYLAADVGQLVGVSGSKVGQWAHYGYIRASRSDGYPKVYSFQDVAEAMVVHDLLFQHFDYREIRRTIDNCYAEYGDWPLTSAPLAISPVGRILLPQGDTLLDIGHGRGNQGWLLAKDDLKAVAGLLMRGGWVIREHSEITHIEVNPKRLSGRPTIKDRRVPVDAVATLAREKGGFTVLKSDYGITAREARDAVKWSDAVAQYGEAA